MVKIFLCALLLINSGSIACQGSRTSPETTPQIEGASFIGSDRAWLTTINGELLQTEDGGVTWKNIGTKGGGFNQVSFIDEARGWAVNEQGQVWRSNDGGQSWGMVTEIKPPADTRFYKAQQMYFADERHGWIVDSFSVWCTEDGGLAWRRCFSPTGSGLGEGQPARYFQVNSRVAWVTATNGEVYRTRDGGQTWQRQTLGKGTSFEGAFFIDEDTGWLGGWPGGGIYHTKDGGNTWQLQLRETATNNIAIDSIHFIDKAEGWAVGRVWPVQVTREPTKGLVLHTVDGGQNWRPVQLKVNELFYKQIYFTDAKHGWLVARDNIYRTTDGGKSWIIVLKLSSQERIKV